MTHCFFVHVTAMRSGDQEVDLDSTQVREQPCVWSLTRRPWLTMHIRASGPLRPLCGVYNSKVKSTSHQTQ